MGIFGYFQKMMNKDHAEQTRLERQWLWSGIRRHRRTVFAVGGLALLGTVMSLISSVISKYLVDAVVGHRADRIGTMVLLMVVMVLGSLGLQALSARVNARAHVQVRNQMQHKTFGRILRAAWEHTEAYRSGDLLSRLNADINTVSDGIIGFIPNLLAALIRFLGALCIVLWFDPVMALVALAGAPVTLVFSRYLMKRLRRYSLTLKETDSEVMSFQEDSLRNLTSIKAFDAVDRYRGEMGRVQAHYADVYLAYNSFRISISTLLSLISMSVMAACFGWGIYQLWTGRITYGSMTMFLQLAGVMRGAFSSLVSLAQQGISMLTSARRVMDIEALPREDAQVIEGLEEEKKVDIVLKKAEFHYQSGDVVLRSVDFHACDGDQVVIMGPSGEGKTTLLRILLGLVEPCSGTAEIVGTEGRIYPIGAGTRRLFAYVPQENSIFTGTIAHNLRIVAPEATESEMEQALKVACAWDFVQQFPEGLEHPLGAGGRGISEGQAQRLAIARALLRRAPVLLLDEATSGLDMETERKLMENLRGSGMVRTCILVTHRPNSAEFCTRAYEIRQGRVSEIPHGVESEGGSSGVR